jgi:hypothetical protein|tara:strand:+ start:232 stop:498 length:267 start_codon:yes stop_codon:yes gene_type:complete
MKIPDLDYHNLKTIPNTNHKISVDFINIIEKIKDIELEENIEGYRQMKQENIPIYKGNLLKQLSPRLKLVMLNEQSPTGQDYKGFMKV